MNQKGKKKIYGIKNNHYKLSLVRAIELFSQTNVKYRLVK